MIGQKCKKTFIDLFSGIGGFRLALEKKGLKCVFSSEIDEAAKDVYEKNFGDRPSGDIRKIKASDIPQHDILCGGFPCQSFSQSGHNKGFQDDNGKLFFEIIRIAYCCRPSILLLENVPQILRSRKKPINTILKKIDQIGYWVYPMLLNASHYGVPQSRSRVYFICIRRDLNICLLYTSPSPRD